MPSLPFHSPPHHPKDQACSLLCTYYNGNQCFPMGMKGYPPLLALPHHQHSKMASSPESHPRNLFLHHFHANRDSDQTLLAEHLKLLLFKVQSRGLHLQTSQIPAALFGGGRGPGDTEQTRSASSTSRHPPPALFTPFAPLRGGPCPGCRPGPKRPQLTHFLDDPED